MFCKCEGCGTRDGSVAYSSQMQAFVCDECFTDYQDELDAHVYYECKCGAILDPGTKSFAGLNNAASDKGWKVRWKANGEGYEPFCVECGKDVE